MQWSVMAEGKQKNQLAQKEFRFVKTITIIRGGNYKSSRFATSRLSTLFLASTSALLACYRFIGHEHNEHDKLLKLYLFLVLYACLKGV